MKAPVTPSFAIPKGHPAHEMLRAPMSMEQKILDTLIEIRDLLKWQNRDDPPVEPKRVRKAK